MSDADAGMLTLAWRFGVYIAAASFAASTNILPRSSKRMGDHLRQAYQPTRSTQPCIPPGSLNRVSALIAEDKGGNVTSAGWQVTLCDPI